MMHVIFALCATKSRADIYVAGLVKGHSFVSCHELGKHHDDKKEAIRRYGDWVISIAECGDDMLQERFLSLLPQMFTIFNEPTAKATNLTN